MYILLFLFLNGWVSRSVPKINSPKQNFDLFLVTSADQHICKFSWLILVRQKLLFMLKQSLTWLNCFHGTVLVGVHLLLHHLVIRSFVHSSSFIVQQVSGQQSLFSSQQVSGWQSAVRSQWAAVSRVKSAGQQLFRSYVNIDFIFKWVSSVPNMNQP